MKNEQPIAKPIYRDSGLLELHHAFLTIQGEGPFVGTPAVFLRLFGCNLQCPYCDTDYTSSNRSITPQGILNIVQELMPTPGLVVFSGGEPLRQNIGLAVRALTDAGYTVQIETNGTLPPPASLIPEDVTFVCSPKAGKIHPALVPHLAALKYVVHADQIDKRDGLPIRALGHSARPTTAKPPEGFTGIIYVQPIDVEDPVENKRHLDAAIRSCMQFNYRLCIQVHKVINME